MAFLVIATLAILFGPGVLALITAYGIEDIKPTWKQPLLRIGVILLILGGLLFLLLLWSCNDLARHPIQ